MEDWGPSAARRRRVRALPGGAGPEGQSRGTCEGFVERIMAGSLQPGWAEESRHIILGLAI